jgi:uncharacterized RDD family membrane protein YckC
MQCYYCRFENSADEHRCRRCGRRVFTGPAQSAPDLYPVAVSSGGAAAAVAPARYEVALPTRTSTIEEPVAPVPVTGRQQGLFFDPDPSNLIAFPNRRPARRPAGEVKPTAPRRPKAASSVQGSLDFLTPALGPRTLKTSVEAVIYCDAPVATPLHRSFACGLDAGVVVISFGFFLLSFHLFGGQLDLNLKTLPWYGASLAILMFFYSFLWALAGRETPGARWLGLKLIDFDGFPIGRRDRFIRFFAAGLSFASAALGVIWAIADEENLTWHDHISKTFPTFRQ